MAGEPSDEMKADSSEGIHIHPYWMVDGLAKMNDKASSVEMQERYTCDLRSRLAKRCH